MGRWRPMLAYRRRRRAPGFQLSTGGQPAGQAAKGRCEGGRVHLREPSIHPSGKAYAWEASTDPLRAARRPTCRGGRDSHAARSMWCHSSRPRAWSMKSRFPICARRWPRYPPTTIPVGESRQCAVRAGQAGSSLWDEWSQKSDKYDAQAARASGAASVLAPFNLESIFHAAMQGGWVNGVDFPASSLILFLWSRSGGAGQAKRRPSRPICCVLLAFLAKSRTGRTPPASKPSPRFQFRPPSRLPRLCSVGALCDRTSQLAQPVPAQHRPLCIRQEHS